MTRTTIELNCRHCHEPIEHPSSGKPHDWVHETTDDFFCTGFKVLAQPDPQRLYDCAVDALEQCYCLVLPDIRDGLSPQQIQALLTGQDLDESPALARLEEWASEQRWLAINDITTTLLSDEQRDLLDTMDLLDALHQVIADRDISTITDVMLSASNHGLYRYDLDVEIPHYTVLYDPDERRHTLDAIAAAAGVDATDEHIATELTDLVDGAPYGGHLYVIWHTGPADALALAQPREQHPHNTTTVTFRHAHLLVLDHLHGSGHDVAIELITAAWQPHRVSLDAPHIGPGYSWSEVIGGAPSSYGGGYVLH